jgi:uncharacterized protein DUF3108
LFASLLLWLPLTLAGAAAVAQVETSLVPYVRPGEELVYRVRSQHFGEIGQATMRVLEDTIAGRRAYRLTFDFQARVVLFGISDRTRSWLDAETLSTLRYTKEERSPVGRRAEVVDINFADSSWSERGVRRPLAAGAPLDELAFIYLVRNIDPLTETPTVIARHFDPARNPVRLCMLGRETIEALGRSFDALVVQMDVPDRRQRDGHNRLRFYVGEPPERLVLRIDSSMPVAGALTLTLIAVNNALARQ